MGHDNLKIVKLTRNDYIYKIIKPARPFVPNKKMFACVFVFLISIAVLFSFNYVDYVPLNEVAHTAAYIQNPINPLFSDMGDIVFTSGGSIIRLKEKKLNFVSPVIYDDVIEDNGTLKFSASISPVLVAIEDGVVSNIYMEGQTKCLKIKHSKNVYSILKNVDVLGVHIGAIVSKGKNIGTIKLPSTVTLIIETGGIQNTLSIEGDNICVN